MSQSLDSPAGKGPLLRVDSLTKRYGSGETGVLALDGVSFSLAQGRLLAVLGPSGSGKTTLLSMIAGLLTPTSGEIELNGQAVHLQRGRQAAAFRRRHVGLVFQEPHLIPYLSARENVLLVSRLSGRPDPHDRARADELLAGFGLAGRGGHKPAELSGGERQRVALARALMNRPTILLIDEPTSHLDTERGRQVLDLLREQVDGRGVTCVMVTHDQRMTELADATLRLVDGRVDEVMSGPASPMLNP
jgi:putative ABC transport system ATP-binding protein